MSESFAVPGAFLRASPYGTGHINDTYATCWKVNGAEKAYILQRINHEIFHSPPQVMENIGRVSAHLRGKTSAVSDSNPDREVLTVVPSRDGAMFFQDQFGEYWRTYVFVTDARTVDVCEHPRQAYEAAKAFGHFQRMLIDLPAPRLHDTIPFFHHTPRRFAALEQAIASDPRGRATSAQQEISFALARRDFTSRVTDAMASGRIPERITHNDTKVNNVMLDCVTDRGVCVIDLDTIMPGTILYDFGDMIRTMARTCAEDEPNPARVNCSLDMFEAVARGYLESAGDFLLPAEIELLTFAGVLVTFNIGIRFLTDYLLGDTYFKIHRPGHNLDRARVQFRMIESMERQEKALDAIINRHR